MVCDDVQSHPDAAGAEIKFHVRRGIHFAEGRARHVDRKLLVEGCPLYAVYQAGCVQLDARLRGATGERAKQQISLKNMEHIKRAIENVVAKESLKLESGLILLAIAVSGAPFLGLLARSGA